MKKFFFMAAMASVALASCVNDVSDVAAEQQKEIAFTLPVVGNVGRSVFKEFDGVYPNTESFRVFGVWHENAFVSWSGSTLYINGDGDKGANVAYDDTYNGWRFDENGKRYYWPKNGKLSFAAYSPSDIAASNVTYGATGLTLSGFQVAADNNNHVDVLFSNRTIDQTSSTGVNKPYDGVDIDFRHALSSIHFTAKLNQDYPGTTIRLKKISIYGVYTQADFVEGIADAATSTTSARWINHSSYNQYVPETNPYVYYSNDDGQVLSTGMFVMKDNASQKDIIALPQTLPDDAKIRIDYTIQSPDSGEIEQFHTVTIKSLSTTWAPETRYIYNMTFSFNEIYFSPEITTWGTGTDVSGNGN